MSHTLAGVRIDERLVHAILDRLERDAPEVRSNLRRAQRYRYRVTSLVVEIDRSDVPVRYSVPTRNLSRDGISFLLSSFVHIGTPCRVRLVSEHNVACEVVGRVVRCRYIEGSPHVHEVGVAFDTPIDIAVFHRGASAVRVLLVDDDASRQQLLDHLLKRFSAQVQAVTTAEEAAQLALSTPFDLVIVNFESRRLRGCELNSRLRSAGYVRPIVSLSMSASGELSQHCTQRQCDACEAVPFTRDALASFVELLRNEPVISSLVQDPSMAGVINQFVADMLPNVSDLERAFREDEPAELEALVRRIRGLAEYSGFDVISSCADELLQALSTKQPRSVLRVSLSALVRTCLGARPASQIHDASAAAAPAPSPPAP